MGSVHGEDGDTVLEILLRGVLQVAPVAAGTVFISRGQYHYAAVTSFVISYMWWWNAGASSGYRSWEYAAVYACGASLGALLGMWGSRRLS
jgi:uncharacterized membrane protein YfcA